MLGKLRYYFTPKTNINEDSQRRAGLLIFGLIVVIIASFAYLVVTFILVLPRGMMVMAGLLLSTITLLLLFKKNALAYRAIANLFLLASTSACGFSVFFDGGIYSSILPWLSLIAVGAIILLSKREAFIWAAIVSLLVISFSFMNYNDIAMNKDVPKSVVPVFISITTLGLIAAFFFMVQYFEDTLFN
jgi:hypothetical protein